MKRYIKDWIYTGSQSVKGFLLFMLKVILPSVAIIGVAVLPLYLLDTSYEPLDVSYLVVVIPSAIVYSVFSSRKFFSGRNK